MFPQCAVPRAALPRPDIGESYQVNVAMEAFANGGLLGRGPGEGRVKNVLPDAHADFVFAVAGEEFGMVICLVILGLFAFVVVRGLMRLLAENDLFVMLAGTGLLTQFGLQAFINMASTLHLIPPKGMTLPFVSYGEAPPSSPSRGRDGDAAGADAGGGWVRAAPARAPTGMPIPPPWRRGAAVRGPGRRPISSSPPAGTAGTCSRPRRWRPSCLRRGERVAADDRCAVLRL